MAWQRYISPEEAARKRSVTTATIRKWLREGNIQGIKMGRLWRVLDEDTDVAGELESREIALVSKATRQISGSMKTLGELIEGGGNIQVIRSICALLPVLEETSAKLNALSEMMTQIGIDQDESTEETEP